MYKEFEQMVIDENIKNEREKTYLEEVVNFLAEIINASNLLFI